MPQHRRKEAWPLRLCYFLFYRLMAKLSDIRLPLDTGDFGLMSRRVVDEIRRLPEHHRYLRGLRTWVGYRQTGISVERSERHPRKSKYGFWRLLKLASDGLFAFSIVPIRAAAMFGAMAVGASMLFGIYAVLQKFAFHKSPQGFTALLLLITFLSGVLLFFLGVIGEYVAEFTRRPSVGPTTSLAKCFEQVSPAEYAGSLRIAPANGGNSRRHCAPQVLMPLPAAAIGNPFAEAALARAIEYLSPPAAVSMADRWFEIASLDHFWVRRRFEVWASPPAPSSLRRKTWRKSAAATACCNARWKINSVSQSQPIQSKEDDFA